MDDDLKQIRWIGDSRERLREFPAEARREFGYQLELLQHGREPSAWKAMPAVGSGVMEIRVHAGSEFRVFYIAKFDEAIYVLHAFVKKTRKTSRRDIEIGKKRYRELQIRQK